VTGSTSPTPSRLSRLALALRLGPRARLALLVGTLVVLFVVVALGGPSTEQIRAALEPAGAAAPIAWLVVAPPLSLALVPGGLLAGSAGLLFGPALGFGLSLISATVTAFLAMQIGRRVGQEGFERLSGQRLEALGSGLERNGFTAVVVARLTPGLPDAPVSYAAGLTRIRPRDLVLGTLVGSAPRAFAYSALGGSLGNLGSPLAIAAYVVLVIAGIGGAEAARRGAMRSRRRHRKGEPATRTT
jgi:uncharacterized membrane protein YdjX (TVP38/TMEM64 family)